MTDPDPTRWRHPGWCYPTNTHPCSCGLSAFREAVESGDPLAVLDVLGMGGTLEATDDEHVCMCERFDGRDGYCGCGHPINDHAINRGMRCYADPDPLYRVVRPLPESEKP